MTTFRIFLSFLVCVLFLFLTWHVDEMRLVVIYGMNTLPLPPPPPSKQKKGGEREESEEEEGVNMVMTNLSGMFIYFLSRAIGV